MPRTSKLTKLTQHNDLRASEPANTSIGLPSTHQAADNSSELLGAAEKRRRIDLGSNELPRSFPSATLGYHPMGDALDDIPTQSGPSSHHPPHAQPVNEQPLDFLADQSDPTFGSPDPGLIQLPNDWMEFGLAGHESQIVDGPGDQQISAVQDEFLADFGDDDCEELMEEICKELEAGRRLEVYQALGKHNLYICTYFIFNVPFIVIQHQDLSSLKKPLMP